MPSPIRSKKSERLSPSFILLVLPFLTSSNPCNLLVGEKTGILNYSNIGWDRRLISHLSPSVTFLSWNEVVQMTAEYVVCLNLMFITSVILYIANDGEIIVFVNSDGKDNNITRLVIVVGCNYGTFTLEMPFIAIIHLLAMKTKCCCKFFLLTVLHLLHTVIDGEVL